MRQLLSSGDLAAILDVWSDTVDELPHYRTTAPLARATALIAHGLTERASQSLHRAERGAAWERALEHRLFVETLVHAFEGRWPDALTLAEKLKDLPLPASLWARSRTTTLRKAAFALARAFGHCANSGDLRRLAAAAQQHPLVYWPMSYAQAVICIDQGKASRALRLIDNAPDWSDDSVFRAFQTELSQVASTNQRS